MSEHANNIVFLLGAGFNQELKDWDDLKPPMARNFFQLIRQSSHYENIYHEQLRKVYGFIQEYWKLEEEEISRKEFDLEKLFTFLQLTIDDIYKKERYDELIELHSIQDSLVTVFINFLQRFDLHHIRFELYQRFGKKLMEFKPDIITFNYDLYLENILESASGLNVSIPESFSNVHNLDDFNLPDDIIRYSHYKYNIPLAYGFKFDIVRIFMAGNRKYEFGERFYDFHELYTNPIIKLHGSLNWSKIRQIPTDRITLQALNKEFIGNLIISNEYWDPNFNNDFKGWIVTPHIITPTLYKRGFFDQFPFKDLWSMAKKKLSHCNKLIIIGYSFSPTDFHTEKLFLDSFKENELQDLIIVNPDTSIIRKIKELTHFNHPVTMCSNLFEFMDIFNDIIE
ncbi:hypothetical protein LCGC14_1088020 [marine sediment metagenome]|uniref:SIR2-like domain-containing protein n=1 Tax=marine sediment metagenome TaxID=412755 RepID=A0A0F9PWF9_9ZZZZ